MEIPLLDMWEYSPTTQSIFRVVLALFMMMFIFGLVFDFYLLAASKKIIEQAKLVKEEMKIAKVAVDFGNGTKRAFEGEVPNTGLTLYELLMTVGEVGNVDIKFTTSTGNGMTVEAIGDNLNNKDGHNWLVIFPSLGWSKPINEIGLDSVVLTGGGTAKLVYR